MRFINLLTLAALFSSTPAFAQDAPSAPATEEAAEAPAPDAEAPKDAPAPDAEAPKDAPKKELPEVSVPSTDEEAIKDVQEAISAVQKGQWATFAILLLGLLGFAYNKFAGVKKEAASAAAPPSGDSK